MDMHGDMHQAHLCSVGCVLVFGSADDGSIGQPVDMHVVSQYKSGPGACHHAWHCTPHHKLKHKPHYKCGRGACHHV